MRKNRIVALLLVLVLLMGALSSCAGLKLPDGLQGAKGEKGEKGDTGAQGEAGKDGVDGKNGASLLVGNGAPAVDLGVVGDSYIDLDSWDFYNKTADGWSVLGNIRGGEDKAENDELNGEYGLHHIVVETIASGAKTTYNVGDTYLGLLMSSSTISVTLNNGTGLMSYDFGDVITTNITYEVVGDTFIMNCEDAVDILYRHPQNRYELAIDQIDGKVCLVLTVSSAYTVYSYYVVKLQ